MGSHEAPLIDFRPGLTDPRSLGRWWVDDQGRFIDYVRVGSTRTSHRVSLRLLGMIEVVAEKNTVHIRWDVTSVLGAAIVSVGLFMSKRHVDTHITLEFFWGAWNREFFNKSSTALARMSELATFRTIEPFKGVKRSIRSVSNIRSEGDLLSKSFELWNEGKGHFAKGHNYSLGRMSSYALSFRYEERSARLVFDHIGEKSGSIQVFGKEWAKDALGRNCDRSQPDFEFDERVCDAYHDVLETGEPMVDHIRAIIRRDGSDPVWVPYRRLVVPTKDRLGAPIVVSTCDIRQDLAISFMAS